MKYYLISAQDASRLEVTDFRQGNNEIGYIVTPGDLVSATEDILSAAKELTADEAKTIINKIVK